jgi:hypothetical protein
MKKHNSQEAFYARLKELADVKNTSVKESKTRNLGTLIDYKRAADGVAYGIIKEQHHYYVKKAGTKESPDVSDFAYIGGLSNITNFQYKSLGEADKQRNMIFCTINEATSLRPSKTGSKRKLNEDKAGEEIEKAASEIGDLDTATAAEATPEMPVDTEVPLEPAPEGGEQAPVEEPTGEEAPAEEPTGEEVPAEEPTGEEAPEGGEEVPAEEPTGEEAPEGDTTATPEDEKSLTIKEIEKSLGKVTNKIRTTELEPGQVKSYVNSFLAAFKDKFDDIEIEDRKVMADKILKVVPDEDVEELGAEVPQDSEEVPAEEPEVAEEVCAECGGFGKYAESRGYDSPQAFMECGEEEQGNVISGYANAFGDGQNDGDFKLVALLVTPEMLDKLKGDYGHDEYAEKLTPYMNSMNECGLEEKQAQINELWGGLKSLGKAAVGGIKKGAQAVGGAVQKGAQAVGQAAQKAGQAVKQTYYAGEVNPAYERLSNTASKLGQDINKAIQTAQKAGQETPSVKEILDKLTAALGVPPIPVGKDGKPLNVGAYQAYKMGKKGQSIAPEKVNIAAEGVVDPGNVEVQPNMLKEEDEPEEVEKGDVDVKDGAGEEKKTTFFAPDSQNLGVDIMKPESAPMTTVDVTIQPDKTVNVSMNETEQKLRKYIRARLEEKIGVRKPMLTEGKKSPVLTKLDSVIDKQFKLYESVVLKKKVKPFSEAPKKVNEVMGVNITKREQVAAGLRKLNPNDNVAIDNLMKVAFDVLTNPSFAAAMGAARGATPKAEKIAILKQFVAKGHGDVRVGKEGKLIYVPEFKNKSLEGPAENPFSFA